MARDPGLEELIGEDLRPTPGVTEKAMFGGWAWLFEGRLLCAARDDGMLVRLGKGNDAWALAMDGVVPMISRGRPVQGWVRAHAGVYGEDALRRELLSRAMAFVASLPDQ